MIKHLKKGLVQHISLSIIVLGAVCFFISNIVMKEVLTDKNYGQYSIFVTYFSLIYLLGLLGTEQGFLRFSRKLNNNIITTQKVQLTLLFVVIVITSTICSLCFNFFYQEIQINFLLLYLSSFSMISLLFLFNILRLNTNFLFSQLISNFWKFILLITSILYYFLNYNDLKQYIYIISYGIVLIFVLALIYVFNKIKINYNDDINKREIYISAFHFSLSIITFSLITFSDRFVIEKKFSIEEFGNYFYLTNFFLAPFSILQNYIGFKQLIIFKSNFHPNYFKTFLKKSIFLGVFMSLILLGLSLFANYYNFIDFSFTKYYFIIFLLLLTGVLRLYSSSITSAFEAITSIQTLRKSNIYIIFVTLVILLIAIFFSNSIEFILTCFIIIWFSRSFIHKKLLITQLKKMNR